MSYAPALHTIYLPKPASPLPALLRFVGGSALFGVAAWALVSFTLLLS